MSTELVKPATGFQIDKHSVPFDKFIEITLKSGAYKDVKTPYELIMKVVYGHALGLDPATALSSIHLIQGKPTMSANLMAGRVKQYGGGKYRYEIVEKTDKKCSIQFWELIEDWTTEGKQIKRWVKPGPPEVFTMEMAKAAGLDKNDNWRKYPLNMLFARCMSNGVKTYCPEVLSGLPVYTPDELDPSIHYQTDGDELVPVQTPSAPVRQVEPKPAPAPVKVAYVEVNLEEELRRMLLETKTDEKSFLSKQFDTDSVSQLTVPEMEQAIKVLKMKLAAPKVAQPTV